MEKDIKFTVRLTRKAYEKEKHEKIHPIIGYRPSKEIGVDDEPVYGSEVIGYENVTISEFQKVLAEYEQIPLIVGNIPVSVIQTGYNKCDEEGIQICEKVANAGDFCSIDKLNQTVLKANFYHPASPYVISFGYEYIDETGEKKSYQFETQEERDKSALKETGYEFQKLDWIDRVISKKENHDSPKKAIR